MLRTSRQVISREATQDSNNTSNNADTAKQAAYEFCAFRIQEPKNDFASFDFRMPHHASGHHPIANL